MLGFCELIPRRKCAAIEALLAHRNERIREFIAELLAGDVRRRAEFRLLDEPLAEEVP